MMWLKGLGALRTLIRSESIEQGAFVDPVATNTVVVTHRVPVGLVSIACALRPEGVDGMKYVVARRVTDMKKHTLQWDVVARGRFRLGKDSHTVLLPGKTSRESSYRLHLYRDECSDEVCFEVVRQRRT